MKARMNQALNFALVDEMSSDPRVVTWGEDVAEFGGVFQVTEGLLEEFGPKRVRDTPISEMAFLGAGVGAAVAGLRPVVEIMIVEFLGVALDQLATQAGKFHYLSGGTTKVPLTVRTSVGAGFGFGCQHSQTLEGWIYTTPGVKLVVPSGAATAYGLLRAAIRDDGPVVVLEHHALYGKRESFERGDDALLPLGKARRLCEGTDFTLVTSGQLVPVSERVARRNAWSVDLIDLYSLVPYDKEMIAASVAKTHRLVIVEESPQSYGWGTEVASFAAGELFGDLAAPVLRVTTPDAPPPYSPPLESQWLPNDTYIAQQVSEWLATGCIPRRWWEEGKASA